ncbi:MAG TPA: cell wall-binding repeat-containing protein [Solirubrobacteraceae bacterium]
MRVSYLRAAILALGLCGALTGCGKSFSARTTPRGSVPASVPSRGGAVSIDTTNTTRLGGATPIIDAAAVAIAAYPGLTPATRPRAAVLVDDGDWPGALAASVLTGAPLHAPLLYSEGATLPEASNLALRAMGPRGTGALGAKTSDTANRTQVIGIGQTATPPGYVTRLLTGNEPAALAVTIERLSSTLRGHAPHQVIVTAANGPPAMTMPAAGLSAQTGAPILFVSRASIPRATAAELTRLGRTAIYIVGPSAVVSKAVARELMRFGSVTRIAGATPASNAIAVARFSDGSFGWGVVEPGHGLVFANSSRPLDAPAAAPLSASGDYGPLLLLEGPDELSGELSSYLSDLQPGSPPSGPVHGVYNHGWLIGDEDAISARTQAQLDSVLGISSRPAVEPTVASPTTPSSESTPSAEP